MDSHLRNTRRVASAASYRLVAALLLLTSTVMILTAPTVWSEPQRLTPESANIAGSEQQDGFYPPLPGPKTPDDCLQSLPITVSLPNDFLDPSVPSSTVIIEPVTTTLMDSTTSNGANLIGFQGDVTFDSSVITFASPFVQRAGLTSDPNWNVSGNILTGTSTIETLRISAFMGSFTALNGSGTLFALRMRRVSSTVGAMSPLIWGGCQAGQEFSFIDDNLNAYDANTPNGLIAIQALCGLTEGFDDVANLTPTNWIMQNHSQPGPGTTGWFQGSTNQFVAQSGPANSYIAANYDNGTGTSTLSNWLLTPPVGLQNGAQFSFWTRTVSSPIYADRLQVRMSTNGSSSNVGTTATDVGDFTTLLLDINPTYTLTDYPAVWTQYNLSISGLGSSTIGRLAFRYFVENGGPNGTRSDYIGIDTVQYACPSPTPTPTPTPTPPTTPTPTATPTPPVSISGTILYCSNPVTQPVPNVTLTLTGSASGSTSTDGSGNYIFSGLPGGGTYTVMPSKAQLVPGAANINTADVIATQRHFLSCGGSDPAACLSGCRLAAADVNGNGRVDTVDVTAIQRFFLGASTGIGNVGKYQFTPTSRTYTGVLANQTAQNYDAFVYGDCASHFVE